MAKHSNLIDVCLSCQQKLLQADMRLQVWFLRDVKPEFPEAHVSWSYRNQADQEKAFNEGKSRCHYPDSKHNKTDAQGKPCAKALDLFQLDDQGRAQFPILFYEQIAHKMDPLTMKWGGSFKKIKDFDHFELI